MDLKIILIKLIEFYQKNLSPIKKPCCRFYPVCSRYAKEAVRKHGALKGSFLALCRLLRCNPLFKSGYDPVP